MKMHRRHARSTLTPSWDKTRPYLTNSVEHDVEVSETTYPLSSYPPELQEPLAIDDVLYMLMGIRGVFTYDVLERNSMVSSEALARMLIPIAKDYVVIRGFVEETRGAVEAGGFVRQALGVGLREVLEEYLEEVCEWEGLLRKGELGMQKLVLLARGWGRRLELLRRVVVGVGDVKGGGCVEVVQSFGMRACGGESEVMRKLGRMCAEPVLDMMGLWLRKGRVEDPHGEFFVVENPKYGKGGKGFDQDPLSKYWEEHYVINQDNVPTAISPYVEKVLRAGKYLNVLRECDVEFDIRDDIWLNDRSKIDGMLSVDAARKIGRAVNMAYEEASKRLMRHLKETSKLMRCLRFLKHFFLLQQGDFLVTFLDAAGPELAKERGKISLSKLRSLLGLSIKTSGACSDPFSDELSCELLSFDLTSQLLVLLDKNRARSGYESQAASLSKNRKALTGYDAFALDYKVQWPLSLVVSRMAVLKYQMLFRYIFHCKHVERELGECWGNHSRRKDRSRSLRPLFARSYALRHRMMQFLGNILYYTVADVLEPNWQNFEEESRNVGTIDELMELHMGFLDLCLTQCVFSNEKHLKTFHSVTQVCLLFAAYVKRFSQEITKDMTDGDISLLLEDKNYSATIEKFEAAFNSNIQKVLEGLSAMSKRRADTHLANLCDRLDYTGYYEQKAAFSK